MTSLQSSYAGSNDYGPHGATRAALAAASLAGSTWNQYASAASGFMMFIAGMGVTLAAVTNMHVEMWVCSLFESHRKAGRPLGPSTARPKVSAVRAILREYGNPLPSSPGVASVLAGYQRIVNSTAPPRAVKAPWPSHYTKSVLQHATLLLPMVQAKGGDVTANELEKLTCMAVIIFATITFCRSDTSGAVRRQEIHFGPAGMFLRLTKQKRPRAEVPIQTQPWRHGPHCPVRFLQGFLSFQAQHGYQPTSLAFGVGPKATRPMTLDRAVRTIVKELTLDEPRHNPFTGHCLRVGSISDAAQLGVPLHVISAMAGHKRSETTRGYLRPGVPVTAAVKLFYSWLLPAALLDQQLVACLDKRGQNTSRQSK